MTAAAPTPSPATGPRLNVLGVGVSAVNVPTVVATIDGWIRAREPHYICITGVHGVMESQRDEALRRIHNDAGLVTPDGMPLVWLHHLAGNRLVDRVYGPDLMLAVCAHGVTRGYRHFFYGGQEGVAELLSRRLTARFPGLEIAGVYCPAFRNLTEQEEQDLAMAVERSRADVIWVGLGTPKQERWMASHVGRLTAPVLIGVGAAFDFHAGLKRQAPRWMRRSGLEWSFRLVSEPRRLWRRYLMNNPRFVWRVLLQSAGLKRYQLDIS